MSPPDYPLLHNALRTRLREQQLSLCLRVTMNRSGEVAFLARAAGFDALYVDLEHSGITLPEACQIGFTAAALGFPALARIPSHHDASTAPLLDAGFSGIIAPHVEDAEQAAQVANACKFPPLGHRSAAGPGIHTHFEHLPAEELSRRMNDAVLVAVMLESEQAISRASEIALVPGVDVLFVGTADLAAQLGVAGRPDHPRVQEAYREAAAACRAHGKTLGVGGIADAAILNQYVGLGARFISAGTDKELLLSAGRARTQELRHRLGAEASPIAPQLHT